LVRDLSLRLGHWPWAAAWPLLIVVGFEAGLGLVQASSGNTLGTTGTYANRDHYAGLLEMILPFAAVYALSVLQANRGQFESQVVPALKASFLLAIAAVILVAIVLSLSRMGFLVALASLLVAGSVAFSLRTWRVEYRVEGRWWRKWMPTAIVSFVILLGLVFLPTDPLMARFADLAKSDKVPAEMRIQIWRDTAKLIKDYPLFGCGMGSYQSCFSRYKIVAPMNIVDYAHNDYLQVLAEAGVLAFAAGLLFVLRVFQRAVRGILYAHSIDERNVAIACVASMTAMLLHSFVDFNMYVPANALVFAWVTGIAGVNAGKRRPRKPGHVPQEDPEALG